MRYDQGMTSTAPNTTKPATARQRRHLSALAMRTGKALPADLWESFEAAETRLRRTKYWRIYRAQHPI